MMVAARKLMALAVSCLPLQVTAHEAVNPPRDDPPSLAALLTRQDEPQADLLDRALVAMGLKSNASNIQIIRISGSQFRTRSIVTTIALNSMDQIVVPYGSQTVTYDYSSDDLTQRIDKIAGLAPLWVFARPNLDPMDYSVVVRGGSDGFAAVVEGSFALFAPDAPPEGLVDGYLAAVMILDSYKWNPLLVQQIRASGNFTLRYERIENNFRMPAVYDQSTGLSVLFDPDTYLPHVIRSYEDHPFFGPSTNDLRVYNYTSVNGVMIPRHFKVIYNNEQLITDFYTDDISINPSLPATFFDAPNNMAPYNVPVVDNTRTAQIGEQLANYIWWGRFNGTLDQLDAQQPFADMPGVWIVRLPEIYQYRQILLEMDDYVIALDAPFEQAPLLLEWSMQTLGKPIRQVWPTHHHHDHAFGVKTYVAAGAEVVVPEMATQYYANIPGIKFATYKYGEPYVAETANFRATYMHLEGSVHAQDHSIGIVMPACPTNDSSVVVFDADHVISAELLPTHNDHVEIDQLVVALAKHRVAKSALLVPVHGIMMNMTSVYDTIGYRFPEYTPLDYEYLGKKCVAQ